MNANQRAQVNAARLKSIRDSYCIDATGQHSAGYIENAKKAYDKLDHEQNEQVSRNNQEVHTMPMYQKD